MTAKRDVSQATSRRILVMLCVQVAVLHAGQSMIIPILPLFAQTFGVSLALVGGLLAAQAAPRMLVSVPAGRLADRIGAHNLMAIACGVSAIAAVGSMLAPTFGFLVAARVVQAVATAGSQTAGLTYAAGLGSEKRRGRKISIFQGSFLLGNSVGPVLGGVLAQHFGYRLPFGVFAAIAVGVGLWVLWKLPDQRGREEAVVDARGEPVSRMSMRVMVMNGVILTACLMGLLSAYSRSGSRDYALVVLSNERGIDSGKIGLALTLLFLMNVAMMYVVGALTDKWGPRAVMAPSWIMVGSGLVFLAASDTTWALFAAAVLYGLGAGFSNSAPAVQIANTVAASSRGSALGLYRAFNDLGLVLGASVMALMAASVGLLWGVWFNVALVFAAALAYLVGPWLMARRNRNRPHELNAAHTGQQSHVPNE
jgi:DHA1 family multidrug resistance protein-like MFS transporter